MNTVIYVDKLLAVNLIIGMILLLSSSKVCGVPIKRKGLILGSLLSCASSLLIFLPQENIVLSVLLKLVCVTVIVFFTFFPHSVKAFLKCFGAFFAVNFIFAGIILAVKFLPVGNGIVYINGAVYFDISALMLIVMFGVCYGALCLGQYFIAKRAYTGDKLELEISYRGKTVAASALLDSGSSLKESFSGRPVIISELISASGLLEPQELAFFKGKCFTGEVPESLKTDVRLIPYKALGTEGVLPAFKADSVRFVYNGKEYVIENVYIGIVTQELSSGEYRAIANKLLLEH